MRVSGARSLHRAVRNRCASVVEILLQAGADPALPNKNGSTAKDLTLSNTGRGGSGSPEVKEEHAAIVRLLEAATE